VVTAQTANRLAGDSRQLSPFIPSHTECSIRGPGISSIGFKSTQQPEFADGRSCWLASTTGVQTMTDDNPLVSRARALLKAKDAGGAIKLLQDGIENEATDRSAVEMLGVLTFRMKQYEAAQEAFRHLTRLDPRDPAAWINLGAVLNVRGDYKGASDALRKAIQRDKKSAIAYYNLAIAQKALNQPRMAISAYEECLRLEPSNVEATVNLANLLLSQSKFPKAVAVIKAGLEHSPQSVKLARLLRKAEAGVESNRLKVSPFGRLVNEEELATRQKLLQKRELTRAQRNHEREFIRETVRDLRHTVRPVIPLLNDALPKQMHNLHMSVFQQDARYDGFAAYDGLVSTMNELATGFATISEGISAIRAQLKKTDPGL
jgi:tetratricopeptide (TPR) repeat protein